MAQDETGQSVSVPSTKYDEAYFLNACEGYQEYLDSEGQHLSRRLSAAFELAQVSPGMCILDVGCGRGEILRHCTQLGAQVHGIDYAQVAVCLSRDLMRQSEYPTRVYQANARHLPFADGIFDRILMFDLVEHLYPDELHQALRETHRVLTSTGRLIIHTAPNRWYDAYAYPLVRRVRHLMGQGAQYPKNPRALNVDVNVDVHVNEQGILSLRRVLKKAGFRSRVWLDTPPQNRDEGPVMAALRHIAFNWPPFRWFFERELFAVATK